MTAKSEKHLEKRQAWGTTIAATPPMKKIQAQVAGWFASGATEEDVRRRLEAVAVDDDHIGLRAFLHINRKLSRQPAAVAAVAIAKHYAAKIGNKRLLDVLSSWAHDLKLDTWLADYHIAWYRSGSPPPLGEQPFGGVVRTAIGPPGEKIPLVIVMAGPGCDPEQLSEEFVNRCHREFPEWSRRKEHSARDAERVRQHADGMSDFHIAKVELEAEGWGVSAADKREYNFGVRTRANAVFQARKRWEAYMTEVLDSTSGKSG